MFILRFLRVGKWMGFRNLYFELFVEINLRGYSL